MKIIVILLLFSIRLRLQLKSAAFEQFLSRTFHSAQKLRLLDVAWDLTEFFRATNTHDGIVEQNLSLVPKPTLIEIGR